jgi:glycosyltransferase involved in cell wall biosynthesis
MCARNIVERYFLVSVAMGRLPKVVSEAAACGLPIIARKYYEPETVVDGSQDFWSEKTMNFFSSGFPACAPCRTRGNGFAGREHIRSFDWKTIVQRWEDVFARLVPQNGARA